MKPFGIFHCTGYRNWKPYRVRIHRSNCPRFFWAVSERSGRIREEFESFEQAQAAAQKMAKERGTEAVPCKICKPATHN